MKNTIQIEVNGEKRETPSGTTIRCLLDQLGLHAGRVAIEYNREILPKAEWETTEIAPGDTFEIVQFVGGG